MLLLRLVTCVFVGFTFASCSSTKTDPVAACGAYFDAQSAITVRCHRTLPLSADDLARERSRFLVACNLTMSEAGTGTTADSLSACAASLPADLCSNFQFDPACATPVGTIESGQPCDSNAQCQTGICGGGAPSGTSCGVCSAVLETGAACGFSIGDLPCNTSAECLTGTCIAIVRSDVGASCDPGSTDCKSGICDERAHTCALPLPAGGSCHAEWDCVDGLTCYAGICSTPIALGASCTTQEASGPPCAPGLYCDQPTQKCVAASLAAPGAPCDNNTKPCVIGACNGTCPQVLADGAACDPSSGSVTCDFFAECTDGKCSPTGFTSCK